MPARLFRIVVQVPDVNRASVFYARLLGTPGMRVSAGRHYFDCGGTLLACFDPKADGDKFAPQPNPDHVYFAVEELDKTFETAKVMGCKKIDEKIVTRPWGERSFYAQDPFGNPICFVDAKTVFTGAKKAPG